MQYINLLCNLLGLRHNIKKSNEQIKEIQNKKLRTLLTHAYDHSPYYHRSFEAAGITREQLSTLPLSAFPKIDKALLMEHFDELVTVPELRQEALRAFDRVESQNQATFLAKYHIVHSSGSTGTPGYFVYDNEAWEQMLLGIIRAALWGMSTLQIAKLLLRRPRVVYVAATDGRYGGAMAVGGGIEGLHMKQLFLDIKTPLPEWVASLKRFQPNLIIGYPSAIKILGELVEKGEVKLDILRVISCGEPLGSQMCAYLERVFQADVVNIYGASESLALGVEINHEDGMFLFDDLNYIEVEDGVMYLTCLYNMVQPLIRYRISDQLTLHEAATSRYPFTQVENIVGRSEDLLWFEDESGTLEFLHPLAIEGFCIEGLIDFQFKQTSKSKFLMIAEAPNQQQHEEIRLRMQVDMCKILEEKNLGYVNFEIQFTDSIRPNPLTGKKSLIVA